MLRWKCLPLLAAMLAGCSSSSPIIPDKEVAISPSLHPPLETVILVAAVGVAAFYVVDPLAPNWEVRVHQLDDARVEINLRKKRFSTGGDGEAMNLFRRKAQEIAEESGSPGFSILRYSEGIDSETTVARRFSRGVIRLLPPA